MSSLLICLVLLAALSIYALAAALLAQRRRPPQWEFVTVGGRRLHYVRRGRGSTVVLLHGCDGFLRDFLFAVAEPLSQAFDVIAFDRPGHGFSDPPPGLSTPASQAALLHEAVARLGVRHAILVGHSWGAAVAMAWALAYPEDVGGLVLLAGWLYAPERPAPLIQRLLLAVPRMPLVGAPLAWLVASPVKGAVIRHFLRLGFAPDVVPPDYAAAASALWLRWPAMLRVFAQELTFDRAALREQAPRYPSIRAPAVILAGGCDRFVDPEQSARLHAALPGSELRVLPRTGHELPQGRADAVVAAVHRCAERATTALTAGAAPDARERARALVYRYGWNPTAYQILNPGMSYWFALDGEAVVGYETSGRVRVVAGAPVCAEPRLAEVARAFEADAAARGERVCYFAAVARLRAALEEAEPGWYAAIVVGAQPSWRLDHWGDIVARHASLRAQLNRARNKGVAVSEWPAARASASPGRAELERCLDEWLRTRALPRLGFLTQPVGPDRLGDRRIFAAERGGAVVAFLLATPVPDRNGWLIEQIVRGRGAVNGTAELLVDTAMRALATSGAEYATLGLAPLSRRAPDGQAASNQAPGIRLLLAWLRAHGRRFYNFGGLDAFKAKFRPDSWEPVFALSREPTFSLATLYAVADVFSQGPPLRALLRAVTAAARQEAAWAARRVKRG